MASKYDYYTLIVSFTFVVYSTSPLYLFRHLFSYHLSSPSTDWQPESEQYKIKMAERERQIMAIPGSDERWENWMQFTQARLVPTFTEHGFEKVRVPAALQAKLAKAVQEVSIVCQQ